MPRNKLRILPAAVLLAMLANSAFCQLPAFIIEGQGSFFQSWQYVIKSRADWAFLGFLLSYILLNLLLYSSTLDRVFLWHALFQTGIFIYLMEFFNIMPDLPWLRDRPHLLQYVVYSIRMV